MINLERKRNKTNPNCKEESYMSLRSSDSKYPQFNKYEPNTVPSRSFANYAVLLFTTHGVSHCKKWKVQLRAIILRRGLKVLSSHSKN